MLFSVPDEINLVVELRDSISQADKYLNRVITQVYGGDILKQASALLATSRDVDVCGFDGLLSGVQALSLANQRLIVRVITLYFYPNDEHLSSDTSLAQRHLASIFPRWSRATFHAGAGLLHQIPRILACSATPRQRSTTPSYSQFTDKILDRRYTSAPRIGERI